MNKKIKLYIVDIEETTISRLEELFYNNPQLGIKVFGTAHNYNSCYNELSRAKEADVFLVSAYLPDMMGVELIQPIKKVNPNAKVIIMLQKNTRNLAEASIAKGADDTIQKPFKANTLIETILGFFPEENGGEHPSVEETPAKAPETSADEADRFDSIDSSRKAFTIEPASKERELYPSPAGADEDEDGERALTEAIRPSKSQDKNKKPPFVPGASKRTLFDAYTENPAASRLYNGDDDFQGDKPNVVCVFSSTSSAGKTSMLVNTAMAIHKFSDYKPRICILDFNLLFPSVLYKFHQDDLILCKRNIYDICEDLNDLSENLIRQALVTHEPTGIKILETPSDIIRDLSRVSPESIGLLVTHLREMFDLILIDTSSNIRDDATSYPLTIADKAVVLLEPDLASLLHTRKFMTMMRVFENNLSEKITPKLNFVLNKENPKAQIHVDTIKKTLYNTDVRLTIPEDHNITHLANNGQFIVDTAYPASKSVKELARLIYPFERELSLSKKKGSGKNNILSSLFKRK